MKINPQFRSARSFALRPPVSCCSENSSFSQESMQLSPQAQIFMMFRELLSMFQDVSEYSYSASRNPNFGIPSDIECSVAGPARPQSDPLEVRKTSSEPHRSTPSEPKRGEVKVRPLRQGNAVSCGQTSVAMAVNFLTGKNLSDSDIAKRYGFGLLSALNSESRGSGYRWSDGGNFKAKDWPIIERKLNRERTPVLIGLNGPEFSPSGRGHIVTLLSIQGQTVRYADPADGRVKTTTRSSIESARSHPDGKFFFYATRQKVG